MLSTDLYGLMLGLICVYSSSNFVCSGETEAEEERPPRRLLAGRSQPSQAPSRRLLGGQAGPTRPVRIPGASPVPKGTGSRPRRGPGRAVSRSVIHQDLLAPVIPGHDLDDEAVSEAEAEEVGAGGASMGAERPGMGTVRRRLGDDTVPRSQPQKSAAALRDVRDDFGGAQEQHEEFAVQSEPQNPKTVCQDESILGKLSRCRQYTQHSRYIKAVATQT